MNEFRYVWVWTKTNERGIRIINCNNRNEFLENLNMWNQQGNGLWIYFEA